jgi:translocation and assembly module TamB
VLILRRLTLGLLALIVLLPLALLALANTGPGRRLIEVETRSLTGGMVKLQGLAGRFPDSLRVARIEISDARGAWLTLDDVGLDWSPTALLRGTAEIDTLRAARITVPRLAVSSGRSSGDGGFALPVGVVVHRLLVDRIDLGAPIATVPASARIAGSGHFRSLADAQASIAIDRLDKPGSYRLEAALIPGAITARLHGAEPASGLVAGLAKLPALGPLAVDASIDGPRSAERMDATLSAGGLSASAHGVVNLQGRSAQLDVAATAPAMQPRPDLSWSGIKLAAHVRGAFTAPEVAGHAVLTDVRGGGAEIGNLTLDAGGNRGSVDVHMVLAGVILPPPKPDLFAAAPLDLTLHLALDQKDMPVNFALTSALVTADGSATMGGELSARIHTVIPDIARLAAIGHVDLRGRTEAVASMATHGRTTDLTVDGTAEFTGGQSPVPALLGKTGFGVTATLRGQDLTVSRALVDGAVLHASLTGTDLASGFDLSWRVVLSDLAKATPQLVGKLDAAGRVTGPAKDFGVAADIAGDVGTPAIRPERVNLTLQAAGLPTRPSGSVAVSGRFAGAPVSLVAEMRRLDGTIRAEIRRAAWKSLEATAQLAWAAGAPFPSGEVAARMGRLGDLSKLIGQELAGDVRARITTTQSAVPEVKIDASIGDLAAGQMAVRRLSLSGHVRDPAHDPQLALKLAADGLHAPGVTGGAQLSADGRLAALAVRAHAALLVADAPANLAVQALLNLREKQIEVSALSADYKGDDVRLRAPARVTFGASTGVDRLSLAVGQAMLEVSGKVSPSLDLVATLRHVTPELARPFLPDMHASGLLAADAHLMGSITAPQGSLRVQASGLRWLDGPAASLAPGSVLATVLLDGTTARLEAKAQAGAKLRVAARGTAPLRADGALALHATANADLSLLNPALGATGQRAAGLVAVDASIGGSVKAPRIDGRATLADGEIQDFVQGVRIRKITALLTAAGDGIRIAQFSGVAGDGTIGVSGRLGVLAPGFPVDLRITANKAKPLASDLLTTTLDADVKVTGEAEGVLHAGGRIFVRRAEINIPNGLPPSVAVLQLRRPGYKPPPAAPAAPASVVDLAITVDAPSNVFVRGHGLDAELGGTITVGGTSTAPQMGGALQMRTGSFSIAGTTLTFSKGEIGFDGSSVTNKIDPTLDFTADSSANGVTATLSVGGYADAPKITLSSVPDLPQDEVLAQLLFGTSVKDLSAVQIAEIAAALAELSGVTGGGGDPLASVRKGLGLDRLTVGSGSGSSGGASVEAGRYVARGVYVGAKQETAGGSAAELQVDLTKRLKAKAQLSTGGGSLQGATPDNDPGSTIGLSYQFDY